MNTIKDWTVEIIIWLGAQVKTSESDAQTMHLRLNKLKYIKEKIQTLAPYLFPSLPSFSSSAVLEPLPENYVSPWQVAGYFGEGISNVLFAPFDYSTSPANSAHPSSHISVSSASSAPTSSHPPISIHSSSPSAATIVSILSSTPSFESELPSPSQYGSSPSATSPSRSIRSRRSK